MATDHEHPVDPERVARARSALHDAAAQVDLLSLLAEPVRQRVVRALIAVDELCVGDLALALGVTEDSITYATRHLRDAGVVERRRDGRYGFYRLADGPVRDVVTALVTRPPGPAGSAPSG